MQLNKYKFREKKSRFIQRGRSNYLPLEHVDSAASLEPVDPIYGCEKCPVKQMRHFSAPFTKL